MGQGERGNRCAQKARRVVGALLLLSSACANAQDLGFFYGEPTPALAMYVAQVGFAADKCVVEGFVDDTKGAATLLKQFNNLVALRKYTKKAPEFVANMATLSGNYRAAWDASTPEVRQRFCGGFNDEIATKQGAWFRWIGPVQYFRSKFSPISAQSAQRQRNLVGALSSVGAVATSAAGVAAANDALDMTRAGDYGASLQQMEVAGNFNQASAAYADMAHLDGGPPLPLISVLEQENADGTSQVVRCPVTDHFFRYASPVESEIWMRYQRVSMPCREPVAADLQSLQR